MIDQNGIIRYKEPGVHISEIKAVIDSLLQTSTLEKDENAVSDFVLYANYPNPFNPSTKIKFELNKPQNIEIQIFSQRGQIIRSFKNEKYQSGMHEIEWNGMDSQNRMVASGVYIYIINADNRTYQGKMTFLK